MGGVKLQLINRIRLTLESLCLYGFLLTFITLPSLAAPPTIDVWHGDNQRVGHLGTSQDDFNLMGHVLPVEQLQGLTYQINGESPVPLQFRSFRRIVSEGDFNADIPIGRLHMGRNKILLWATNNRGETTEKTINLFKEQGRSELPYSVDWSKVQNAQDVGQIVDGKWAVVADGLRTQQIGYDRVFLFGEQTWQDYDLTTSITVHHVSSQTSPLSGGNGVGIILRFQGHVTGGPLHFPAGQPKFGYQPFGALAFLRWEKGKPEQAPVKQFYRGDENRTENFGQYPLKLNSTYYLRFACQSLDDTPDGAGVTRYRFKVWPAEKGQPKTWDWSLLQTSPIALRTGGAALVAHHVDVTFGNVLIQSSKDP